MRVIKEMIPIIAMIFMAGRDEVDRRILANRLLAEIVPDSFVPALDAISYCNSLTLLPSNAFFFSKLALL